MIRLKNTISRSFRSAVCFDSAGPNFNEGKSSAIFFVSGPLEKCGKSPRGHQHFQRRWHSMSTENGPSYIFHRGSTPLVDITLGQLIEQSANRYPNRECMVSIHQNVRLTFSEVLRRADKLAAGLKKLGLKKGDRVGIWGPNTVEWYLSFAAIARAGFRVVGMNPADQQGELEYMINKVEVRAVVAWNIFKTQNYPAMLLRAKANCPTLEHIIIASDHAITGTRRFVDVESLASRVEVEAVDAEQSEISPNDGATIQFTSGTTGRPKAPEVSHRSYVNNGKQGMQRLELDKGHHTVCLNVPFFHAFGLVMGQVASLYSGATTVLAGPSFNGKEAVNAIAKEKCSVIYGTPTMWVDMVSVQQEMKAPLGKISNGLTGGSPASLELFKRARETFGLDSLKSIYGLSETTAIAFQTFPDTQKSIVETTVGHVSDHVEAQVVDGNGIPVPFGTPGELWVRGYLTMIGYWGDEENTKKTLTDDGWLKTGDQFILGSDGHGKIVGRLKDMLIRGGENIFPKEIEEFLESHPAVMEAHVFGVHDDRLGEEICACIRLRKGIDMTADDIRAYSAGKIAHFKIPRYIQFGEDFPKTTSGKIKKRVLKESLEEQGLIPSEPKLS
ncbi:medium-chain acyl-CoA ligase ACSF2, mitochondrial-like [Athalia rosae]|uniref:medium-chain acyl-CoA ligase ACSF2, mitochondrial-like n=1 Tax=Athalia rosae TaxID=37344 RepID=UPI002033DA78|nr:medium-chain acyl-CoA ligase ACSF2, mitochondrial-like [Athalia rosae]